MTAVPPASLPASSLRYAWFVVALLVPVALLSVFLVLLIRPAEDNRPAA